MKFTYYPGCTLRTKAKQLDIYGRKSLEALGVDFEEVKEWQCCGAVYPISRDEVATKLSAVRTLNSAKVEGEGKLLTLCSACHHVLKRVNGDMKNDENIRFKANNYLALEEEYAGETDVIHYLELLRDYVGFDNIKRAVKNPINKKVGAYYGCLLLRPSKELAFDSPENPTIIEDFIKAIGGTPVIYGMRNECCGAYVSATNKEIAVKKSVKVTDDAMGHGAELLVTACPLCMYNLTENGNKKVPVYYFTELLAEALGVKE
ncbi:MAG: CoB--CoM heterodisulfide reductase iron-sulfur subunit B family protein [Clostridia bacterium]|nr:CoB--CoM heterodisulfide reductase iron-sulfur subunit B family protein [Clostridia bacterium]